MTDGGILQFIWTELWAVWEPSPCLLLLCNCFNLVRTLFLFWCHASLVFILLFPWKWRQLIFIIYRFYFVNLCIINFVLLRTLKSFWKHGVWILNCLLCALPVEHMPSAFLRLLLWTTALSWFTQCYGSVFWGMLVILLFKMTVRYSTKCCVVFLSGRRLSCALTKKAHVLGRLHSDLSYSFVEYFK